MLWDFKVPAVAMWACFRGRDPRWQSINRHAAERDGWRWKSPADCIAGPCYLEYLNAQGESVTDPSKWFRDEGYQFQFCESHILTRGSMLTR